MLLVAHVDTVFKRGEAAKRPFRVDENGFAWGPGVGDDKATVMEVIYGLAALKEAGFDDYKEIIYYTNAEEEGGSPTAEGIATPNTKLPLPAKAGTMATLRSAAPTPFISWLIPLPSCTSWQAQCPANRKILPPKHWKRAAL